MNEESHETIRGEKNITFRTRRREEDDDDERGQGK